MSNRRWYLHPQIFRCSTRPQRSRPSTCIPIYSSRGDATVTGITHTPLDAHCAQDRALLKATRSTGCSL